MSSEAETAETKIMLFI